MDELMASSLNALINAYRALCFPGVFFILVALLIHRQKLLTNWRPVLTESTTNLILITINILLTAPVIAYLDVTLRGMNLALIAASSWEALPPWLLIVVVVFVGDFVGYWRHRFEHSLLLWPSHSTHHSDTHMTWLTLERFHPLNRLSTFFIDTSCLLLLGFPVWAVLVNNIVRHYYGYFIHADIPIDYGRLAPWFVSPMMHRWHHANDRNAYQANFATVFALFDRWFGTYYVPAYAPPRLGVPSHSGGGSYLQQLRYPFLPSSYRKIWQWKRHNGPGNEPVDFQAKKSRLSAGKPKKNGDSVGM